MFKSYIRAFREPFRQWDDFNSDKFWKWFWILIIFDCLKVYPETYKYSNQHVITFAKINKVCSRPIQYNKEYVQYLTKPAKDGQQTLDSMDIASGNPTRYVNTFNPTFQTISRQEFWTLSDSVSINTGLQFKMPALMQYIKPVRSTPEGFNDKKDQDSANYPLELKNQTNAVNSLLTNKNFVSHLSMRKTFTGNIVLYINDRNYYFIGVVNPNKHRLIQCYLKIKNQDDTLSDKKDTLEISQYTFLSMDLYNELFVPPLKALYLNQAYQGYLRQQKEAQESRDSIDHDQQWDPDNPDDTPENGKNDADNSDKDQSNNSQDNQDQQYQNSDQSDDSQNNQDQNNDQSN